MLIESAQPWNVTFNILDAPGSPAERYADQFISGKLTDENAIRALAEISDVITYEIEHINVDALREIEASGKKVIPSSDILAIIQDKGLQKEFYAGNNLNTSPFIIIDDADESVLNENLKSLKGEQLVVKSRTGGYDGKGVQIMNRTDISGNSIKEMLPAVIEEFIPECLEVSVIVARNEQNEIRTFPMVEMVFDPEINLVDFLCSPANVGSEIQQQAADLATKAIKALNGIGLFAVEMFLTKSGELLINEIAPRPHNSGHHTIEACYTSQYGQLMRILLGLPLGNTELHTPAVMANIIGPADVSGDYQLNGLDTLFSTPGAQLHWYNKTETRPGRKMGHFTVLADDVETAIQNMKKIRETLRIVPVAQTGNP